MGTIDAIEIDTDAMHREARSKRIKPSAVVVALIGRMADWSAKRRSRLILRDLTEDQLRDIGLTRSDVRREVAKSFFWD